MGGERSKTKGVRDAESEEGVRLDKDSRKRGAILARGDGARKFCAIIVPLECTFWSLSSCHVHELSLTPFVFSHGVMHPCIFSLGNSLCLHTALRDYQPNTRRNT